MFGEYFYLIVFAIMGSIFFFIIKKLIGSTGNNETDEDRELLASKNQWQYRTIPTEDTKMAPIWYFSGKSQEGVQWEFTTVEHNRGRKLMDRITVQWRTTDITIKDNLVLIGPAMGSAFKQFDNNNTFVRMFLQTLIGDKANDISNLSKIETPLDGELTVIAENPDNAGKLITDDFLGFYAEKSKEFSSKQKPPFMVLSDEDMRLKSSALINNVAGIENFIRNAENIAGEIKRNL